MKRRYDVSFRIDSEYDTDEVIERLEVGLSTTNVQVVELPPLKKPRTLTWQESVIDEDSAMAEQTES